MERKGGDSLTIEEQYNYLPKLLFLVLRYKHLGLTVQDVEDSLQDVVVYNWRAGREINVPFLFRQMEQRARRRVQYHRIDRDARYTSESIMEDGRPSFLGDSIPDRRDYIKSAEIRIGLSCLAKKSWGRTMIQAALGSWTGHESALRSRRSVHREELREIFEGLV